eukprot:46186-Amphidinium_carterae.1
MKWGCLLCVGVLSVQNHYLATIPSSAYNTTLSFICSGMQLQDHYLSEPSSRSGWLACCVLGRLSECLNP